jgi:hypothetical protein
MSYNCWTHLDNGEPEVGSYIFALDKEKYDEVVGHKWTWVDTTYIMIGKYLGKGMLEYEPDAPPHDVVLWHYVPKLAL